MTKVKAQVKWVKISPRKLDRVVKLVRGKPAAEALRILKFMSGKGPGILGRAIQSALANAKNNYKLSEEGMVICEAYVNQGVTMKRWQPRARGRAFPIHKRSSHLTVWLKGKEGN